jgi:hypothetical protein
MRRVKWGLGAAAVVGVAWFLSNFFNLNVGGIGGDGEGEIALPTSVMVGPSQSAPVEPPEQGEPDIQPVTTENAPESAGTNEIVEVLIDDRSYSLRRGTGDAEWVAAELEAIVAYARQAAGDESGVRVRIFRRPSARAAAEEELVEALQGAGVKDAEIDLPEKLVE